jgi:hypothetical protein
LTKAVINQGSSLQAALSRHISRERLLSSQARFHPAPA